MLGPTSLENQSIENVNSHWWFVFYCVGFMNPIGVATGAWSQKLTVSIGPNRVGVT
jgi:hypothetical protein